ncbi:MAG: hypothetical protein AAFY41_19125, partial [Bacteroidota bacterium]
TDTIPDSTYAIFAYRTSAVVPGKLYFDIPEAIVTSEEPNSFPTTASNGLNDQDLGAGVDVELGGTLDKPTTVQSFDGNNTLRFPFSDIVGGPLDGRFSEFSLSAGFSEMTNVFQQIGEDRTTRFDGDGLTARVLARDENTRETALINVNTTIGLQLSFADDDVAAQPLSLLTMKGEDIDITSGPTGGNIFARSQILVRPQTVVLVGIPSYIDDAAADADTNLPSGGVYQIAGDRTLRIKP